MIRGATCRRVKRKPPEYQHRRLDLYAGEELTPSLIKQGESFNLPDDSLSVATIAQGV